MSLKISDVDGRDSPDYKSLAKNQVKKNADRCLRYLRFDP